MISRICFFSFCLLLVVVSGASALSVEPVKRYFLLGDYKQAIREGEQQLASAKRTSSGLDELYYYLALSYLKDGNALRASDIFEIIIGEMGSSRFKEEAMLGSADTYFMRGDFNTAARVCKQLLRSYPRTKLRPAVYYRFVQIGRRSHDLALEKEYQAKLKAEYPSSPEASCRTELFPQQPIPAAQLPAAAVIEKPALPKAAPETQHAAAPAVAPPAAPALREKPEIKAAPMIITLDEPVLAEPALRFFVQVGAFSSRANAYKLRDTLRKQGFAAAVAESVSKNKSIYKVRVGAFEDARQAKESEKKLIRLGYPTKIIP